MSSDEVFAGHDEMFREEFAWIAQEPDFGSMSELFAAPHTSERHRERLGVIADIIAKRPEALHMASWHTPANELCGTSHCLAGWAAHLAGIVCPSEGFIALGRLLLGDRAAGMFFEFDNGTVRQWLDQFRSEEA